MMKIAIDESPLKSGNYLQHRVRGTGTYIVNLKRSLLNLNTKDELSFFTRREKVPKDADIIHYPYFEPFFLTLPLRKHAKTVVTVHDLTPLVFRKEFPAGIKGALKWKLQKKSLERSNAIITDSNSSKKDIERIVNFSPDKIHVVYLAAGSAFKQVSEENRRKVINKFNLPNEFILYVGDVTWNKNLPRLIRSVNKTSYSLVIIGKAFKSDDYDRSNPWNKDLELSQDLAGKNKKIISLGFVDTTDLVSLYNTAVLFVMPSLYEGFGLPVLEAMASGCPVVTSKAGSLSEVAGEAAYCVDPTSEDSITQGIKKVYEDKKIRQSLSLLGLEQSKKFSWEKTALGTMKVYREVWGNK